MTISYKWLSDYLPVKTEPEKLAKILTSIGLEVESFDYYEEIRGGLKGLVVGEVLSAEKHPNADKLTLTKVSIGNGDPLQIVCGAPNVAIGQKVVVARAGTTIYPTDGEPLTMKVARIRNVESQGMICAEDEVGLGTSHDGILVLDKDAVAGTAVADYFQLDDDWVYEIGVTPNRMDAMSHWGVARDLCAYLSHRENKIYKIRDQGPFQSQIQHFKPDNQDLQISVEVENIQACQRYSGLTLSGITVKESPAWLQERLKAIGLRPISNIVDITNFIQHETGQPLHAFDADEIRGKKIIVKNLPAGTPFITLDEKERKLSADDLMICDGEGGICIAGVFGGLHSGVTEKTCNIFLESAWFNPVDIRKTSFRHNLRTDAAMRFEKNIDISNTVHVLKRAALMIKELGGGLISSEIVDIYPRPEEKKQVSLKYHYLKKLSGKSYHPDTVKNILSALGFEIVKDDIDEIRVAVPYSKPDITLPADLVEEILRIDGLDNIEIPSAITITPATEKDHLSGVLWEKTANYLTGQGFHEMMTNSITNASYYNEEDLKQAVRMLNSLSAELNIMRPSLLETSLEAVARNLNHKNEDLKLFERGKIYQSIDTELADGSKTSYAETQQVALVISGHLKPDGWKEKKIRADIYYLKGLISSVFELLGLEPELTDQLPDTRLDEYLVYKMQGDILASAGRISGKTLEHFDIKQPVYFAALNWDDVLRHAARNVLMISELPRFPAMLRDISMIVPVSLSYKEVENSVNKLRLTRLQEIKLFDIFESEKLGPGKKSMAVSFRFQDTEKTLTDKEIEGWMKKIMETLEKELQAEIRK